jgi:tetratricopeptide (TPR) repeat protein
VAQEGSWSADRLVTTADHFERADLALDAAHYSLLAAEELATRFAHDAVADQAARGLRLSAEDDHARRWRLLLVRQRALRHSGQAEAHEAMLSALEQLAQSTADLLQRATAAMRRLVALQESGQTQRALEIAPQALALAQQVADAELEATCGNSWAGALRVSGQHEQAVQVAQQALQRARTAGMGALESELLNGLGAVAIERGDLLAAQQHVRQALGIERRLRNRIGECAALINLGANALQRGDFEQAGGDLEEALRLSRAIGRRQFEITIHLNRSALGLALRRLDLAEEAARAARALAELTRNDESLAFADLSLGAALLALQRPAEAEPAFRAAREGLLTLQLPHLAIEAAGGLARVALAQHDAGQAATWAESIHALWLVQGHFNGTERPSDLCLACHEVWGDSDPRAVALARYAWGSVATQASRLPREASELLWQSHASHVRLQELARTHGWA